MFKTFKNRLLYAKFYKNCEQLYEQKKKALLDKHKTGAGINLLIPLFIEINLLQTLFGIKEVINETNFIDIIRHYPDK